MSSDERIFYGFLAVLAIGCALALAIPEHFETVAGYAVGLLLLACSAFLTGNYLIEARQKDRAGNIAGAAISAAATVYIVHILTK